MFKDKPIFTVFGGAYVAEHHNEFVCDPEAQPSGDRSSWIVASTLILALTICVAEITFFAGRSSGLL